MDTIELYGKLQNRCRRGVARFFFRRVLAIRGDVPTISFTFDDFPRSALTAGGAILKDAGAVGTYYASLGLVGKNEPTGSIFVPEDLKLLLEDGHELGSHTFGHHNAWETDPGVFENSVLENEAALRVLCPQISFRTFSYPVSAPWPQTKRLIGRRFACCRGGGQTFNTGMADLNFLRAYFLDRNRSNPREVKRLIDANSRARGWLIFATHDVAGSPTRFGCTPDLFEGIVKYARQSGAQILPVIRAWEFYSGSASTSYETVNPEKGRNSSDR